MDPVQNHGIALFEKEFILFELLFPNSSIELKKSSMYNKGSLLLMCHT